MSVSGIIDVVIPAQNEAKTVGSIIRAFTTVPNVRQVIVVDDCSEDNTYNIAANSGAYVIQGNGLGKGEAVTHGLVLVKTERVILCDADLTGFTAAHAQLLSQEFPGEILGLTTNYSKLVILPNRLIITGERALNTEFLRRIPLHGWAMEMQINEAVDRAGMMIKRVRLDGVYGEYRRGVLRAGDIAKDMG